MAAEGTDASKCNPLAAATIDTQAGVSELEGTMMAPAETEALECNSYDTTAVYAKAGESKLDGTTRAAETESFECDPYSTDTVSPIDVQAVGHACGDGVITTSLKTEVLDLASCAMISVDAVEVQGVGSENNSSLVEFSEGKTVDCGFPAMTSVGTVDSHSGVIPNKYDGIIVLAEREALECDPFTVASVDAVDTQEGGGEHGGTVIVSASEALECDPCATASVDTVDLQAGGSEQDVTMMASAETESLECNPYATTAVDLGVMVEEGTATTSPRAQNVQQDATNLVSGDNEVSVTVLGSITHLGTSVAQSVCMVSNQEGSFSLACPADEIEEGKFEEVVVHSMEEIQGEEHVYDIGEFDIGAHEVPMTETFFGKHCMFPALHGDKSEIWQAAGDDVIMEDGSFEHDRDQQENVDAKSSPTETNSVIVVNHSGEKVVTEEKCTQSTQSQLSYETVPIDAVHGVEESSGLKTSILQGSHVHNHVKLGDVQCGEVDIENVQGLASDIVKGEESLYNDPENVEVNMECDADDIFVRFSGENTEIVQAAGSYDTRSSEDRLNINKNVEEVENAADPSNMKYQDASVHSYNFDLDLPGSSSKLGAENTHPDITSNDKELQRKSQTTVDGSRTETHESHKEKVTQAGIQWKSTSLDYAPSVIEFENDECTDLPSNEFGMCEQSVEVRKDALPSEKDLNDFSGATCTNNQSLNLAGNTEPLSVPVKGEQEENGPVIVSSEISIDAVSQSLAQEETVPLNQNVTHYTVMLNNNEPEVAHMVSLMEVDTLHKEQAEKQGDDLLLTHGESVDELDGTVLDSRRSDGEVILEDGDAVVDNKVVGPEKEKGAINGQQEEELYPRQPVDTLPRQAKTAKEGEKQELSMKMITQLFSSSDPGGDMSSCTDFTERNKLSEGLNNDEKPALQGLESSKQSRERKHRVSSKDADAFSKKQLEGHINDHKSPRAKGLKKLDSRIVEAKQGAKSGKETYDDGCPSEHEEELSDRKLHKSHKEGNAFGIGDLVWAKVRSHPWWPAQIFDPADASKSARKAKKSGRVLVAFFGDCTFAWLQQSQMIAFRPNFKEKVKQTTMRIFCMAVEEALEEFCRRSELGLSCAHFKGSLHSTSSFPDANAGIREGARVERHNDIHTSIQMFRPNKTLEFVKSVACSPLGAWSSTLQISELRGHAYGLRTCMVSSGSLDTAPLPIIHIVPSQGSKLKRSYSSLKSEVARGGSKEAGRLNSGKDKRASEGKDCSQILKRLKTAIAGEGDQTEGWGSDAKSEAVVRSSLDASEGNKGRRLIKFKVSKKTEQDSLSGFEGLLDTAAGQEVGSERSSDDDRETLLAFAGNSVKVLNRPGLKKDTDLSSIKKKVRKQTAGESPKHAHRTVNVSLSGGAPGSEAAASIRTDAYTDDAFTITSSLLSEGRVSNAEVIKGKHKKKLVDFACSPVSSIDANDLQEGTLQTKHSKFSKVGARDEMKKEVATKKEVLGNDKDAGKKDAVKKLNKVGDIIRKVAGELTGTPVVKCFDDASTKSTGPGEKKKMKDFALELQASPTSKKAAFKESTEEVSLLRFRRNLELLANKAGSGGFTRKGVKHSKKGDQVGAVTAKSLPHWQNVPHRKQRSSVQELALAARKRKSEIVHDEVSMKLPKNSSTVGSQRHQTSKTYITSAEKPAERRSFDKSLLHYSRRPAPPAPNVKGSSQRYDEKLSSHMPLGLFMRFPEDFPLPSESQLTAMFIPFGPLQMSATRLYKDSSSAQVVFKHGRDAESALKHAKKNAMFGQVVVTYRLRYLLHSSRVETKIDPPSLNRAHPSSIAPGRRSFSSKEKVGGPSATSEIRAGDKEGGASVILTPSNNATHSEPTGDIKDQMLTLLRQVSVIVNTSPSDDT